MVQALWAIFTFSQCVPRQSLDQWKMVFCNPPELDLVNINGYVKFEHVFHMIQEIYRANLTFSEFGYRRSFDQDRSVSLFQHSDLGKASTNDTCHLVNL